MATILGQELSPAKRSLLALRLRGGQAVRRNHIPIEPLSRNDRENRFPLSIPQEGIWFLDRITGGNAALNMPAAVSIHGPLNKTALRQALREVVRRHEIMRTYIDCERGEPKQTVVPFLEVNIEENDLPGISVDGREAEAIREAEREAHRPLDLGCPPLFRVRLIHLNHHEHILIFVLHHVIADGWSVGLLTHELNLCYKAFVTGTALPLPPLSIQYADFSSWQRRMIESNYFSSERAYWKKELQADVPALKLSFDRSQERTRTFKGATERVWLPVQLNQQLKVIAVQFHSTLFMLLFAAFAAVMHRYSDQSRFAIGTDVAGRGQLALEQLIGVFTNQLAVVCDLSGKPRFSELVARVRTKLLEAYAHQSLPFERLVAELNIKRDSGMTPLFKVKFVMPNIPLPDFDLPDLKTRFIELNPGSTKFDLTLFVEEIQSALRVTAEYSTDVFNTETIQLLFKSFQETLAAITADPNLSLESLI